MATLCPLASTHKLAVEIYGVHQCRTGETVISASSSQFICGQASGFPLFVKCNVSQKQGRRGRLVGTQRGRFLVACEVKNETKTPPTADASPLVKMAWYGSEAFGKLVAAFRPSSSAGEEEEEEAFVGPVSRKEVVELIRKDYERSYFVTGNMAMGIYEPQCEFADPFVSFKGLKRFKQNVSNLGSFMEESSLKITDWQEYEDRIYARWRFNCVLGLPWRPILAATGSTEYFFDSDSGKICKHVENWDISPADGVRQLFKPNPRPKRNNS